MSTIAAVRTRWTGLGSLRRPWPGTRRRTTTFSLLALDIAVLNAVGSVMVLSASSVSSLDAHGSAWYLFERQILWTGVAAAAFIVASRVDYRAWRGLVGPLLVVAALLLVVVLAPGVGIKVSGSRRWLGYGAWRIQPTELAKLALLLFGADVLARRRRELGDWRCGLRPVVLVFVGFAFLVMLEPDMASTIVLGVIVVTVLVVGGVRLRHLLTVGGLLAATASLLAIIEPYRRARMFSFLDPSKDASNAGYQVTQSLIALGSGGWTGVGLGAGRAKWMFLPNAHTDFIFAVIGEELGLIGCLLVVGLFSTLAALGTRTALRAPDRFGMLVAAGVTAWITGQAIINIGAVIGLLPVSGIPLPFVSFGGSALVFTMAAAGILANVARQGRRVAS